MEKINISVAKIEMLEEISFEVDCRKNLIVHLLQNDVKSKVFYQYERDYKEFMAKLIAIKEEVSNEIAKQIGKQPKKWFVNYANYEVSYEC